MASSSSSLPDHTGLRGVRKPVRPARRPLDSVSISDAANNNTSYGSEDTLRGRQRATTDAGPVVSATLLDRRFARRSQRPTPLNVPHFDRLNLTNNPSTVLQPTSPLVERSSAPITVPNRKSPPSRPITPLTGREPSFFVHSPKQSHTPPQRSVSKDFTPSPDSQSQSSQSESDLFAPPHVTRRTMRPDQGGTSSMYTPSSPLSPTTVAYSKPSFHQQSARAHPKQPLGRTQPAPLAIPSLPPFHPANYESRPPSHSSRAPSSPHGRQLSDAQKKLHKYQRELVMNATRVACGNTARSPVPRPTSPRLDPLGSPGPVTPLMLEAQGDYFLGGSRTASPAALKDSERRDMVERMIAVERDRIDRPGRADRHSPAVSPAGGPG
ncbi:MAG: hypothetical protein LQ345_003222 [Seirophora villosa]|nr:MAG: hypothetical protein LQ345_003222 [Seirophora villosa]